MTWPWQRGAHVSFLCWLFGHDEPFWLVRTRGSGWLCPTCLRYRASAVLRRSA